MKKLLLYLFLSGFTVPVFAQVTDSLTNDINALLDSSQSTVKAPKQYVIATFKSTRVINGHSVENVGKGILDFRIDHRFGALNSGVTTFYGFDNATTKIAFDYGLTNWLMIGIGRSTLYKEYDGSLKIKLLRQTTNNQNPVSLSYVGGLSVQSLPAPQLAAGDTYYFSNRVTYFNELLIARKFSNSFSLQLMPVHIHYNLVDSTKDHNDLLALGMGARLKVSRRIAITGEYFYTFDPLSNVGGQPVYNALSVGIDIETGGHVFQLFFTNSTGITERTFIGQTTGNWAKGDIHFGFNISRVFTIIKPKGFENSRNKIW
ncbi:MAG: hypothetical protein H0X33_00610 [Taibaiella sp.]|nr:hypothetical protein [Taibaiella sp.]